MFITHDLGVIAEVADDVIVMYAGQVIESADVVSLFDRPHHPYTMGLLASIPDGRRSRDSELPTIKGSVPSLKALPKGCRFAERCPFVDDACVVERPLLQTIEAGHSVACHFAKDIVSGRRKPTASHAQRGTQ
jgi:peptide/nickel transport system ATP-binding protein